jgi:hypothetical protein
MHQLALAKVKQLLNKMKIKSFVEINLDPCIHSWKNSFFIS